MITYTPTPDFYNDYICHHGIKGQQWGVRNGPPYPLDSKVSTGSRLKSGGKGKIVKKKSLGKQWKAEGKLPRNATHQNLESWGKSPRTNVLYISGKSGSGKSTVALKIKDENTEIIHLDHYFDGEGGTNKSFNKYLKSKGISDKAEMNVDYLEAFENSLESYGEDSYKNGKKVIAEGVQLLDDTVRPDKSYFKDKPFVMVNTNSLTSSIRADRRDEKKFELSDISKRMEVNKQVKNVKKNNRLRHQMEGI